MPTTHPLAVHLRSRLAALGLLVAASACSGPAPFELEKPGPGLAYSFPMDGQWDVPTGTRLVLSFSDPIDAGALQSGCQENGAEITGAFCVVGPDGPVGESPTIAGANGSVLHLSADLQPGAEYRVYARPALLAPTSGQTPDNLPENEPILTFHTRQTRILSGQPLVPLRVNGSEPSGFVNGGAPHRFPTMDFSSFRVLFSEPVDPHTVIVGDTFRFYEATSGDPVPGTLLVQGIHLTFDPTDDLTPGTVYRMDLSEGILDMGGEALQRHEFEFTPESSRLADGSLIEQVLNAHPADGDDSFPGMDSIAGAVPNGIDLSNPLVGDNTIFIKDGSVVSHMADPTLFGGPIPLTIRRGQRLSSTGLDLALGGVIPAGLSTGDIEVTFASDATGLITRNPYRDPMLPPDEVGSPLFVQLVFDVAVTASDPAGNAVLNQTILNVQATGAAAIVDEALAIETAGTMELDLLGVAQAPSNMVLRLQTTAGTGMDAEPPSDNAPPTLLSSYPAPASDAFARSDSVVLTFSEPIDASGLNRTSLLTRVNDGAEIPTHVLTTGSSLVITPMAALAAGESYLLFLDGTLTDLSGNAWTSDASDPTAGMATITFQTPADSGTLSLPPLLTALYPGVPCALTGATAESPGRCVGGQPSDTLYRPFSLPADRAIEGYFNQTMRPQSLTLGPLCNTGAIRVEAVDDTGTCTEAVPGTLHARARGFRFVPAQRWREGQAYHLVIRGGPDAQCNVAEVCALSGKPLNTDPLAGIGTDGGPDIVIPFTATAPASATYLPAAIAVPTDTNGNGFVDVGEVPRPENSAGSEITAVSGIVDDAALDGDDCDPDMPGTQVCLYIAGTLPVEIQAAASGCDLGGEMAPDCVPSVVYPQAMLGTSINMDATATIDPPNNPPFTIIMDDLPTGQLVMRVRDNPDGVYGYIVEGQEGPRFRAVLDLYMDAPDLPLSNFNLDHDLRSKEITLAVAGPVAFTDDGRIRIDASNTEDVVVDVNLSSLTIPGNKGAVTMTIPAGAMKLQLSSRVRQAALLREQLPGL